MVRSLPFLVEAAAAFALAAAESAAALAAAAAAAESSPPAALAAALAGLLRHGRELHPQEKRKGRHETQLRF